MTAGSTAGAQPRLPQANIGGLSVSRLVIGDNPIYGYSHFNQLLSQHYVEWHTSDQVMETLRRAEEVGINAWQNSLTERSAADMRRYREEGGQIQWFALSWSDEWYRNPDKVFEDAKLGPAAMAPHGGGVGDRCLREGKLDLLQDILKRIRDAGALVGLSAHNPRLIEAAEEEGWDVDYYMTALYHLSAARREFAEKFGYEPLGEVYLRDHRDRMLDVVAQASKPCLVYKVLAAGRAIQSRARIRGEFHYALRRMKADDALLIGMYQKYGDQIGENAQLIVELCQDRAD